MSAHEIILLVIIIAFYKNYVNTYEDNVRNSLYIQCLKKISLILHIFLVFVWPPILKTAVR